MSLSFFESFLAGGLIINIASLAGWKGEGGEGRERGENERTEGGSDGRTEGGREGGREDRKEGGRSGSTGWKIVIQWEVEW
jgi:hypothetical protein